MIRFAVWAAVSSIAQVEGVSLDNQLDKGVEYGTAQGWTDTGLRYIADGYSRTGYVNLSEAEKDIPPLGNMLADMRANKFDLLISWNYDRFGDLIVMVATDFRNRKKQLFSIAQPTPVQTDYNPYMDDSSFIMQALAPVWQKQRIADLRRKLAAGMPKRMGNGLHPGKIPFGYRRIGKGEPPEIVPAEAALIRQMYTLLMEGKSFMQIALYCGKSGLKTRTGNNHWHQTQVVRILKNPYYIGSIEWGKTKTVDNKRLRIPQSQRTIYNGKHQPIFTIEEHEKIMFELRVRYERRKRWRLRYPLSGLTYCGKCEQVMEHDIVNRKPALRCKIKPCKYYKYSEILKQVSEQIQRDLKNRSNKPSANVVMVDFSEEIKDIELRIGRVQQSAELGVFTPVQAAKRITELQTSLDDIYRRKNTFDQINLSMKTFSSSLDDLDDMAEWIQDDDPAKVNRLLFSVIRKIMIFPDGKIDIKWRQDVE